MAKETGQPRDSIHRPMRCTELWGCQNSFFTLHSLSQSLYSSAKIIKRAYVDLCEALRDMDIESLLLDHAGMLVINTSAGVTQVVNLKNLSHIREKACRQGYPP